MSDVSSNKLGWKDFMKKAFVNQYNLIPLVGLGVAGFFNPGFWIVGAAWEVAWLTFVPTNERFQRRVRAEANQHIGLRNEEEQEALFRRLDGAERSKFGEIQSICYSLESQLEAAEPSTRKILQESFNRLGYLLKTYLRLLVSLGNIRKYLKSSDRDIILKKIRDLESEISNPETFDRVREVKQKNVIILQQRLTRVEKARENEAVIEANLHTLEDTLKLIRDNAVTLDNPQGVSRQINSVIVGLEESERVLKDIEAFTALEDRVAGDGYEEESTGRERTRV